MQDQLIRIKTKTFENQEVQVVDARDLHEFLEVKTDFRHWIDRRIKEYGFVENSDFRSFLTESTGGRPSKEYHITLDMAKELSMVERNEKGREARRYFIECERRLREQAGGFRSASPILLPAVEDAIGIANAFGFAGNQGLLSANNMLRKTLGIDFLELLGRKALVCEKQERHLTPTEIGRQLGGISAQKVNKLLEKAGVIVSYEDTKKKKKWKPTDKGKPYVIMKDTGKRHSDGTPVQQMFFLESVIGLIPDIGRTSYKEPILSTDDEIRLNDTITRARQAGAAPAEVIGKAFAGVSL